MEIRFSQTFAAVSIPGEAPVDAYKPAEPGTIINSKRRYSYEDRSK
jgi:hypothetical protein